MMAVNKINCSLIFLFLIFFTAGCLKKNEEDPFISLKSRNKRIAGEWILVRSESEFIEITSGGQYGNYIEQIDSFDGIKSTRILRRKYSRPTQTAVYDQAGNFAYWSFVNVPVDTLITEIYDYSLSITLNEDGSSSVASTSMQTSPAPLPAKTYTWTGSWYWGNAQKNKTLIYIAEMGRSGFPFEIKKLSDKELILEFHYNIETIGGNSPKKEFEKGEMFFEKKQK